MFGFLKALTRAGRQALVREAVAQYATQDNIAALAAAGVESALERAVASGTIVQAADRLAEASRFFASVAGALRDGVLTIEERSELSRMAREFVRAYVQQERIDTLVERAVQHVR